MTSLLNITKTLMTLMIISNGKCLCKNVTV